MDLSQNQPKIRWSKSKTTDKNQVVNEFEKMPLLHEKRVALDKHDPQGGARAMANNLTNKRIRGMEGNGYYNNNSRPQLAGAELAVVVWRNAVEQVLQNSNYTTFLQARLQHLQIADYGSSQGKNSIPIVRAALEIIPENTTIVVTHLDLPTNDFNSLMRVVNDPVEGYTKQKTHQVFVSARGGSFYDRVYPDASVHLAWSAFTTHWISVVPDAPLNHFAIHRATNPERIAWIERARQDWYQFVSHRAQELVSGGHFVQVGIAQDDDGLTGCEGIWLLLEDSLKGALSQAQYERLRLPAYSRTKEEFLAPFEAEPDVWQVHVAEHRTASNPFWIEYQEGHDLEKFVESVTGVVRAAYMAGLIREEGYDLKDFYDRFKSGLRKNPELGRMDWRLLILDVERL